MQEKIRFCFIPEKYTYKVVKHFVINPELFLFVDEDMDIFVCDLFPLVYWKKSNICQEISKNKIICYDLLLVHLCYWCW